MLTSVVLMQGFLRFFCSKDRILVDNALILNDILSKQRMWLLFKICRSHSNSNGIPESQPPFNNTMIDNL